VEESIDAYKHVFGALLAQVKLKIVRRLAGMLDKCVGRYLQKFDSGTSTGALIFLSQQYYTGVGDMVNIHGRINIERYLK
jgi:hypothetical protein